MRTLIAGASRTFTERLALAPGMQLNPNVEVNSPSMLHSNDSLIQRRNGLQDHYCKELLRVGCNAGKSIYNLLISKEKLKVPLTGSACGTVRA
jgi:hypothetical protein